MTADQEAERAVADARVAISLAVERLSGSGARDEALARFVPARRVLLFTREPVMEPLGRVWRLGVLLLDRDGVLYRAGSTPRATDPGRPAYQSVSAEVRRSYRAAAFRGPFADGETVDFDAEPISLDIAQLRASAGPLVLDGDRMMVRWSASAGAGVVEEFGRYLSDRVDLLVHPPEGT